VNRMHIFFSAGASALVLFSPPSRSVESAPSCARDAHARPPAFLANTLRQGRFVYRETSANGDTGTFTLEIRRLGGGTWQFTGDGSGQHWEAVTDSAFAPRRSELSITRHGRPYGFQLKYAGDSIHTIEMSFDSAGNVVKKHGSTTIAGTTIDQRIDWASLMSSDLAAGESTNYRVFDLSTGSSELFATASAGPTLPGPGGPRPTVKLDYTICKMGKPESYAVYATTELPRVMLREDLRGNVVSELINIEP
jgi:hypothetical protein